MGTITSGSEAYGLYFLAFESRCEAMVGRNFTGNWVQLQFSQTACFIVYILANDNIY